MLLHWGLAKSHTFQLPTVSYGNLAVTETYYGIFAKYAALVKCKHVFFFYEYWTVNTSFSLMLVTGELLELGVWYLIQILCEVDLLIVSLLL